MRVHKKFIVMSLLVVAALLVLLILLKIYTSKPNKTITVLSDVPGVSVKLVNEKDLQGQLNGVHFWENPLTLNSTQYISAYKNLPAQMKVTDLVIHLTPKEQPLGQFLNYDKNKELYVVESFGLSYEQNASKLHILHIYLYISPDIMKKDKTNVSIRYSGMLLSSLYQLTHTQLTPSLYQSEVILYRRHLNIVPGKSYFKINHE